MDDSLINTLVLGRYEIVGHLGSGGMGDVYRAKDKKNFSTEVAIKVLNKEVSKREPSTIARFQKEAQIGANLPGKHTPTFQEFGETPDGRQVMVTELLRGHPLNQLLKGGKSLGPARTLAMLEQVCIALHEAHSRGIVHRDLKPSNLFVEDSGGLDHFRVLDFGIAKLNTGQPLTITGQFFGTPKYASPEQARSEQLDHRSDLYSLGAVAYQCLVGRAPFSGQDPVGVLRKHLDELPQHIDELVSDVPEPLIDLVHRMLEKAPEDRPDSAQAIIKEVRQIRADEVRKQLAPPHQGSQPVESSAPFEPAAQDSEAEEESRKASPVLLNVGLLAGAVAIFVFVYTAIHIWGGDAVEIASLVDQGVKKGAHSVRTAQSPSRATARDLGLPSSGSPPSSTPNLPVKKAPVKRRSSKVSIRVESRQQQSIKAAVYVDGQKTRQPTPGSFSLLHGRRKVRIEVQGYTDEKTITVPKVRRTVFVLPSAVVRFEVRASSGRSLMSWVLLKVDGKKIKGPEAELGHGAHEASVEVLGHKAQRRLQVRGAQTIRFDVKTGQVRFKVLDTAGQNLTSKTGLVVDGHRIEGGANTVVDLPLGPHTAIFKAPGHPERQKTFTVRGDKKITFVPDL